MKDVTDNFRMGVVDGESMPVEECQCGAAFEHWDQVMNLGEDWECPNCHEIFRASYKVTVLQKQWANP